MTIDLTRRVAVAAVTRGITKVWAVNDPDGTRPQVLIPEPDDQRSNHYRQVQRNHHNETDVFDRDYFEEQPERHRSNQGTVTQDRQTITSGQSVIH
jgi:hypothetical protein